MGYKQSPFPMANGTSKHASALKAVEEKRKLYSTKEDDPSYLTEGQKHNIAAEKLNTTGRWCAICGVERSKHSDKGHAFKVHTPPGSDTKKK